MTTSSRSKSFFTMPGAPSVLRVAIVLAIAVPVLVSVGLLPVIIRWQLLLVFAPLFAIVLLGLMNAPAALCLLVGLAFIVESDATCKTMAISVRIGLFDDPVRLRLPFLFPIIGGVFALRYLLLSVRQNRDTPHIHNVLLVPLLLLSVYSFLSLCWVPNLNVTLPWTLVLTVGICACAMLVKMLCAGGEAMLRRLLWAVVIMGVIDCIVITGFNFIRPRSFVVALSESAWFWIATGGGSLRTDMVGAWWDRFFLTEPHVQSAIMSLFACIGIGLFLVEKRPGYRRFLGAAIVLFIFVLTFTDARGGYIGFLVMCGVLVTFIAKLRQRAVLNYCLLVGITLLCFAFQVWLVDAVTGRTFEPRSLMSFGIVQKVLGGSKTAKYVKVEQSDVSVTLPAARATFWAQSIKGVVESRGLGVGAATAEFVPIHGHTDTFYAHNLYLSGLLEYGFVGFVVLIWIVVRLYGQFIRILKQPDSDIKTIALALCGGLAAAATVGMTFLTLRDAFIWCHLGMTEAAMALALQPKAEKDMPATAMMK